MSGRCSVRTWRGRRRLAAIASAAVAAVTLGVAGPASAAHPTELRSGCTWRTPAEKTRHIQTCAFYSTALSRRTVVQIRASDRAPGRVEQGVYFLDGLGANDDYSTWVSDNLKQLDTFSKGLTLVLPAGGAGEWMTNWESSPVQKGTEVAAPQWDTFLSSELPEYLHDNFSVQRRKNAIVGVSMSGGPAINVALNHPDTFTVVRSYSGFFQTNNPLGWQLIPYIQKDRTDISNGGTAMWGDPSQPGNDWALNDVSERLREIKKNGQTVIISVGNGVPKLTVVEPKNPGVLGVAEVVVAYATGTVLELGSLASTVILNLQASAASTGMPVRFAYNSGSHDWASWAGSAQADAAAIEKALTAKQAG